MDADAFLAVLKIISAAISGILGVYGVFGSFQEDDGKLKRKGKAVVAAVIASAIVGAGASVVEALKAKNDSEQQAARTEQLLREVGRAVQPITHIRLSYNMVIPQDRKAVKDYIARIEQEVEKDQATETPTLSSPILVIKPSSPLWPRSEEAELLQVIRQWHSSIDLFKGPSPLPFPPNPSSDLSAPVSLEMATLAWFREGEVLEVSFEIEYEKRSWRRSGRITAIPDLLGSRIVIMPLLATVDPDEKHLELARSMKVTRAILSLADGNSIFLQRDELQDFTNEHVKNAYTFVFPKTTELMDRYLIY